MERNVVDARGGASEAIISEVIGLVEADGYAILEGACAPDLCDALVAEITRVEHELEVPCGANDFEGFHTRRIYNVLPKSEVFARVPVHPVVLPVVEALLDPGLLLSGITSMNIGPHETVQFLHADDGMVTLPRPHPATMITTLWALDDFTAANGATRFVPGSHRRAEVPRPGEVHETVAAEMPKGSVLVLHAGVWHGGGANTTDHARHGMSVQYVAGWCRQQQNLMLGLDRELVASFPPRLQELIGYGLYRDVMGHVDRKNPATLLGIDRPTDMVWDRIKA